MRLGNLIAYLVSSVLARFLVAGLVILVLRFGPWGNVFQFMGLIEPDPHVNEQFKRMAEALESGQDSAVGLDPYLGPTGTSRSSSYKPPQDSDGLFAADGAIAGFFRKFGFGDGPVRAPAWVPVFPGSIDKGAIRQRTAEGEKKIIRAAVPATGSSVVHFYERAFIKLGYTFTTEQNGGETTLAAENPDGARAVTVAISARGARSTLSLSYLERLRMANRPATASTAEEPSAAAR